MAIIDMPSAATTPVASYTDAICPYWCVAVQGLDRRPCGERASEPADSRIPFWVPLCDDHRREWLDSEQARYRELQWRAGAGAVYIAEREGWVKAGFSTQVNERIRALSKTTRGTICPTTFSPVTDARLLFTAVATLQDEGELHRRLDHVPHIGEWYRPTLEFIGTVHDWITEHAYRHHLDLGQQRGICADWFRVHALSHWLSGVPLVNPMGVAT